VFEDKGAHDLKGVPAPVALYRVVRASGGGRRGGARALTPLVGRQDELVLLIRRWARALEGEGQFAQIVGEPGLGKSRLVEEFRANLPRPLLAPLVDIPLREDRQTRRPPDELRRRQLAAMTSWVLAGARTQPVVLAFQDLHWADPTSLDLLRALAEQSPLLVITTTRPEFRSPCSHHGVVSLAPLDRAQVRRLAVEIASRHALSDETIDRVGERTGGVPLFVEEVTRLLLDRDAPGGAQAIPPTATPRSG
jgi:predicted ATPase